MQLAYKQGADDAKAEGFVSTVLSEAEAIALASGADFALVIDYLRKYTVFDVDRIEKALAFAKEQAARVGGN